jgi:5-methylthioribose kinase
MPMRELSAHTAADYLRESGRVPARVPVEVRELSGGVSNVVLRVDVSGRPPLVLKQCRERLRVALDWRARLERIWAEHATLELLSAILPEGTVPRVWFEDRPNYLFAMSCAPDDAVTWKSLLLAGEIDPEIAARLGTILGTIHAEAPVHPALRGTLADTSLFDELRIDPYYRMAARAHPDLKPRIDALIASMELPRPRRTLVLGDFSPKNILVHKEGVILIDFECGHAGDPAFDLGFFLSHLLLKTIRAAPHDAALASRLAGLVPRFWNAYRDRRRASEAARADLERRAMAHAAACCLARVDGKSPVEYLDEKGQAVARSFAREVLCSGPATWDSLRAVLESAKGRGTVC